MVFPGASGRCMLFFLEALFGRNSDRILIKWYPRVHLAGACFSALRQHVVRTLKESLSDGVPRVIQHIQKCQQTKTKTHEQIKRQLSQPVHIPPPVKVEGSRP
jgi:hypothetical protein